MIAGGFAAYVLGRTKCYNDVDVFFAAEKTGRKTISLLDLIAVARQYKFNQLQFFGWMDGCAYFIFPA